ncbi:MAG: hypothetical protein HY744_32865, partial [Deltaproteobacteria bacterium]|nr:hypothetical protein [Deltaproteobacteria bacterium]
MPRRFPEFAWRGVLLTALLATQCTPAGSPPERRAAPPPDAATARSFAPPQSHSASERSAPRRQPGQQLGQSVRERSDAYELAWSLARKGEALTLDIKLVAREELYVADRLWDSDQAGRRVPDPRGVYRFVRDGSLRLVFAQAPRPPNVAVRIVFAPLYSRVRAGEAHQRTIQLGLPVDEYSALGRDTSAPSAVEEVSKVLLVLAYR